MNIVLKQNKYSLAFGETERKEAMAKQTRNKNLLPAAVLLKWSLQSVYSWSIDVEKTILTSKVIKG